MSSFYASNEDGITGENEAFVTKNMPTSFSLR